MPSIPDLLPDRYAIICRRNIVWIDDYSREKLHRGALWGSIRTGRIWQVSSLTTPAIYQSQFFTGSFFFRAGLSPGGVCLPGNVE